MVTNLEKERFKRDRKVNNIQLIRLWSRNIPSGITLEDIFNIDPVYKIRPLPFHEGDYFHNEDLVTEPFRDGGFNIWRKIKNSSQSEKRQLLRKYQLVKGDLE